MCLENNMYIEYMCSQRRESFIITTYIEMYNMDQFSCIVDTESGQPVCTNGLSTLNIPICFQCPIYLPIKMAL